MHKSKVFQRRASNWDKRGADLEPDVRDVLFLTGLERLTSANYAPLAGFLPDRQAFPQSAG